MNLLINNSYDIVAILPAAGVGHRMCSMLPKQYHTIAGKTLLEHSINHFLSHPRINKIIVVISSNDYRFYNLKLATNNRINTVIGGKTRADSVMAALRYINNTNWVIIHDAVRPCLQHTDLIRLVNITIYSYIGGILATPVRDTIKRSCKKKKYIDYTINRNNMWHALTPQLFNFNLFKKCLNQALKDKANLTDDASALEYYGYKPLLVPCYSNNIKITFPEDLTLAKLFFSRYYYKDH